MQVKVSKKDFEGSLKALKPISPNTCLIDILQNIILKAEQDKLTLIAADSLSVLEYYLPAEVIEEGEAIAPIKELKKIAHSFTGKELIIQGNEKIIRLEDEIGYVTLASSVNIQDFPRLEKFDKGQGVRFNVLDSMLKDLLSISFASEDPSEYHMDLQGVLLQFSQDICRSVATNTSQLAIKTCEGVNLETTVEFFLRDTNIPPLLNISKGSVTLTYTPDYVIFDSNNGRLLAHIPKVKFPDWQSVIPDYQISMRISKDSLLNALKKCLVGRSGTVKLEVKDSKCILENNFENLAISQEIPCTVFDPFELLLDGSYLYAGIENIETDEVGIFYTGKEKPFLVLPVHGDDYLYLLMPKRSPKRA